jgi:SAM-dependent methyltransferase
MEMEKSHNQMLLGFEYWDSIAEKLKSRFVQNPYFEHKRNEVLRLVKEWGKHNQDGAILKTDLYEEAFEPDHLLFSLARSNRKVCGIDISPRLAKMTRQKALQRGVHLDLCVSDLRRLAFKDNKFNLIISTSTLDHFPEIDVALKELYRVLKPRGVIILTLHNTTNLPVYSMYKLMKLFRKYPFGYAEGTCSLGKTKQLMRSVGFSIEDSTAIIHVPPLLPTIMNEIYRKRNGGVLARLCQKTIEFSEAIGKSNSFLKYFTGYCLAVKGTKK